MSKERIPNGDNSGLAQREIKTVAGMPEYSNIEKAYYSELGEKVGNAANYYGNGEVLYSNKNALVDDIESPIDRERLNGMTSRQEARLNDLIWKLSELYGKRKGRSLCPLLENAVEAGYGWGYGCDYTGYIRGLSENEEFYGFTHWYQYAMERYAREEFLPRARAYEKKYISDVQALIEGGLLPEESEWKLQQFRDYKLKYTIVDEVKEQDNAGMCYYNPESDSTITYNISYGLDDDPHSFDDNVSDFEKILCHENTHRIVVSLFDKVIGSENSVHNNNYKESVCGNDPENKEIVTEADRIFREGTTEWLSRIISGATTVDAPIDDEYGSYHVERRVLQYLLNEGDKKINPATWFKVCQDNAVDKIEDRAGRKAVMSALFEAFPSCKTELDVTKLINERFNWYDFQIKKEAKKA